MASDGSIHSDGGSDDSFDFKKEDSSAVQTSSSICSTPSVSASNSNDAATDELELRRNRLARRPSSVSGLDVSFFEHAVDLMHENKYEDAIHELYDLIDISKTGNLESDDLFAFLQQAVGRINIKLEDSVINLAVNSLIADVGGEDDEHHITREQFFQIFRRNPDMYHAFDTKDEVKARSVCVKQSTASRATMSVEEVAEEDAKETEELREHAKTGWRNRGVFIVWVALYVASVIAVFTKTAFKWAKEEEVIAVFGNCIIIARASAETLNFHAALVLLPICRHSMTWLLRTPARFFFPFDAILDAHMMIGFLFAIFASTHTLAHVCDYVRLVKADEEDLIALFGDKIPQPFPESTSARLGFWMKQRATITGITMVICLVAAYSVIRSRRQNFQRFWYLHHLLLIVLVMMMVHGTGNLLQHYQTIYWVCGPLTLYLVPRFYRELQSKSLKVEGVQIHDGVLALDLEKPKSWVGYQMSGMYAFINIPSISRWEWHPFTLSSAPHQEHIGFHIRAAGDWTSKALELMESKVVESALPAGGKDRASIKIRVEGPIGASSQGFGDHEVVVLIGAGIGITPMVSVLRHLLHEPGRMRRAFFYWTVRDMAAFEWFTSLMEDIYQEDTDGILEVRHFLTSAKEDDRDLGAVLFHYAANAIHADTKMDILLGHRSHKQVEVGRPKWGKELSHVIQITKELGYDDCGIFLCGPEVMAEEVRATSAKLSLKDPDFHLYFSKETF